MAQPAVAPPQEKIHSGKSPRFHENLPFFAVFRDQQWVFRLSPSGTVPGSVDGSDFYEADWRFSIKTARYLNRGRFF
jgi:hypothetical protein